MMGDFLMRQPEAVTTARKDSWTSHFPIRAPIALYPPFHASSPSQEHDQGYWALPHIAGAVLSSCPWTFPESH